MWMGLCLMLCEVCVCVWGGGGGGGGGAVWNGICSGRYVHTKPVLFGTSLSLVQNMICSVNAS